MLRSILLVTVLKVTSVLRFICVRLTGTAIQHLQQLFKAVYVYRQGTQLVKVPIMVYHNWFSLRS